jgi:hypothetical protein
MGLSRRAYELRRGCSESAVRKAIATGRIVTEADGTIDAARADGMWDALLSKMIDMRHDLVKLTALMDWEFFEREGGLLVRPEQWLGS